MKRIRISTFLPLFIAAVFGALLFCTSQSVQKASHLMDETTAAMEREREALHVLGADWDYLTTPARLAARAARYLKLSNCGAVARDASALPPLPSEQGGIQHAAAGKGGGQ